MEKDKKKSFVPNHNIQIKMAASKFTYRKPEGTVWNFALETQRNFFFQKKSRKKKVFFGQGRVPFEGQEKHIFLKKYSIAKQEKYTTVRYRTERGRFRTNNGPIEPWFRIFSVLEITDKNSRKAIFINLYTICFHRNSLNIRGNLSPLILSEKNGFGG
jgi:hypothetical protein